MEDKVIPIRQKILREINPKIDALNVVTPEDEQSFLMFVQTQVKKMSQYAKIDNARGDISFYELNEALKNYDEVNRGLMSLYYFAKHDFLKEKDIFDEWFAEKFLEIRKEVNPISLTPQKWASKAEIDMMVRVRFKDEYRTRSAALNEKDLKVSLLRRMLAGWATQNFTLQTLSKNIVAEFGAAMRNPGANDA